MKTLLLSFACAAGLTVSAQAQIFRPQTATNVLVGSVAGAIIGEHNDHRAVEGAAIGAAAGYLWSVATQPPAQPAYAPPVPVVRSRAAAPVYVRSAPAAVCVSAPPTVVIHRPAVVHRRPGRAVYVTPAPVCYSGPRHHAHRRSHRYCD